MKKLKYLDTLLCICNMTFYFFETLSFKHVTRSDIFAAIRTDVRNLNASICCHYDRPYTKYAWREGSVLWVDISGEGFRLSITPRENKVWEIEIIFDFEKPGVFLKILHDLLRTGNEGVYFPRLNNQVEIDDINLKVGEWLAALMFKACGDKAGCAATIDEAQERT